MTKRTYDKYLKKYKLYILQQQLMGKADIGLYDIYNKCAELQDCTNCRQEINSTKDWKSTGLCDIVNQTPQELYSKYFCIHALIWHQAWKGLDAETNKELRIHI